MIITTVDKIPERTENNKQRKNQIGNKISLQVITILPISIDNVHHIYTIIYEC